MISDSKPGIPEVVLTTIGDDTQSDDESSSESEINISGYFVGIPVSPGLFRPRFDLAAWSAYQEAVSEAQHSYQEAYSKWQALQEDERDETPIMESVPMPEFWIEGLSPEEIEELTRPQPVEPNELDRLGIEMVTRELEALELRQQNEAQGAQIVGLELRLLSLEK